MRAPIAFIAALILPLAGCGGVSYPTADGGGDHGSHDMGLVDRGPDITKADGPPADNGSPGDVAKKDSWTPTDGPAIWPDQVVLDGPFYLDAFWPYADAAGPTYPDASAPYPDF
jgi:hypothetical protein